MNYTEMEAKVRKNNVVAGSKLGPELTGRR